MSNQQEVPCKLVIQFLISDHLSFINVHDVGANFLGVLVHLVSCVAFNPTVIVDKSSTQPLSRVKLLS